MAVYALYTLYTPYNAVELSGVGYEQTNDVMYTVHIDKPVKRLTRLGHTEWTWDNVAFGPTVSPPTGVSASRNGDTGDTGYTPHTYRYVVTAISDTLGQESRASAIAEVVNDLTLSNHSNTIVWSALAGASRYVVYKEVNGVFGYIGGTEGLQLTDQNIIADLSNTPPKAQNPFASEGNYPSTVTFHGQRLLLGRTKNKPNRVDGSQTGDFENFDYSRPARDDDAFSQAIVGRRINAINQLVSSGHLLALTADSIYAINTNGDPVTPNAFIPSKQSGRGVSRLRAIEIDEVVFFQPTPGSRVRTLNYTFELDGYKSNDISIFSPHLFKADQVIDWAYQSEPQSCIWAVMASGKLLCFTWQQEQNVWGWTVCETDGYFENVAVITEGAADRVYVTVRRTLNGVERRFYERMAMPHTDDITEACPLDCAVTQVYEQPTTTVGGLWHLEGCTVAAYADGYALTGLAVENGQVELPEAVTNVSVGLPFECLVETLPLRLAAQAGSYHTERQTFASATIRTLDTKGLEALIPGATDWEPMAERDGSQPSGFLPTLGNLDYGVRLDAHWSDGATIQVRQAQPLPAYITGLFLEPLVSP